MVQTLNSRYMLELCFALANTSDMEGHVPMVALRLSLFVINVVVLETAVLVTVVVSLILTKNNSLSGMSRMRHQNSATCHRNQMLLQYGRLRIECCALSAGFKVK